MCGVDGDWQGVCLGGAGWLLASYGHPIQLLSVTNHVQDLLQGLPHNLVRDLSHDLAQDLVQNLVQDLVQDLVQGQVHILVQILVQDGPSTDLEQNISEDLLAHGW